MAKFKENANMFSIVDETKAPIIHGHTRIDLRDVKTGKRERIERDNTFMATTLAKQMRNLGIFANSPLNVQPQYDSWTMRNFVRNLCGGVFLFKDAIPDNSEYMQAGNKMTANGCYNIVNNGNPPELGSWNSIESNIDGNSSAVLVWDWTTSQGNGQISSVCLTSEMGGYIGYGNASGYKISSQREWTNDGISSNNFIIENYKFIKGNYGIKFAYTKPNLTISKYKVPVTQMSIFGKKLASTRVIDLTNYDITNILVFRISDDTVMVWDRKNVVDNENFDFLLINIDDYTVTSKTVVNTTGVTIDSYYFRYHPQDDICIVYGNLASASHSRFIINPTTSAVIRTDNYDYAFNTISPRWQENMYIPHDMSRIYDLINNTDYPTNASIFAGYRYWYYNSEYDAMEYGYDDSNGVSLNANQVTFRKNPLYLATINNLQDSVTKQNTQTMKVTYTLTEV